MPKKAAKSRAMVQCADPPCPFQLYDPKKTTEYDSYAEKLWKSYMDVVRSDTEDAAAGVSLTSHIFHSDLFVERLTKEFKKAVDAFMKLPEKLREHVEYKQRFTKEQVDVLFAFTRSCACVREEWEPINSDGFIWAIIHRPTGGTRICPLSKWEEGDITTTKNEKTLTLPVSW
jgi:hypothetical protein